MWPAEPWEHQSRAHPHSLSSPGWESLRHILVVIPLILLSGKADENSSPEALTGLQMGTAAWELPGTPAAPSSGSHLQLRVWDNACTGHSYLMATISSYFAFLFILWFPAPRPGGCLLFVCAKGVFGVGFYTLTLWDLVFSPIRCLFSIKRAVPSTLVLFILNLLSQYSNTAGARGHP